MNKIKLLLTFGVFLVVSLFQTTTHAQFNDYTFKIGLNAHYLLAQNEFGGNGFLGRTYLRLQLSQPFDLDFGAGYGWFGGDDPTGDSYKTEILPIDLRLMLTPFKGDTWNPYIYAGVGGTWWWLVDRPSNNPPQENWEDFSLLIPIGIGTEIVLGKNWIIDAVVGLNIIMDDHPNGLHANNKDLWYEDWDRYTTLGLGIAYVGENCDADDDNDGLGRCQEEEIGTDPYNADTDGDGLNDGDEIMKYNTDPLKADSNGDGLSDYEKVKIYDLDPNKLDYDGDDLTDYDEIKIYNTDPKNPDTDREGLNDGVEVNTHKTDPNKSDTDVDGLSDHAEVVTHKTDPLNMDSDGDMLDDGEEVMKYKTNPLVQDTDGGSVNDGVEVKRGTDPLNPDDDVILINVPIVLDGIVFETSSAEITSSSEARLHKVLHTMKTHSDIIVEIRGNSDNRGSRSFNMKLSQRRAESVRNWLINQGVDPNRLSAKGFGPDYPIATNKTVDGRRKNRRIEFVRTK